jgi:hypothetical protein
MIGDTVNRYRLTIAYFINFVNATAYTASYVFSISAQKNQGPDENFV